MPKMPRFFSDSFFTTMFSPDTDSGGGDPAFIVQSANLLNGQQQAWIKQQAIPLTTTDPTEPSDDLLPLQQLIGDASQE